MASYPQAFVNFTTHRNVFDVVDAADPNTIQNEVLAIQGAIGLNPSLSTSPLSTGTFVRTSNQWTTLNDRLANIEQGIVSDSHTQYIRRTGGELIVNASGATVALTVQGAVNQGVNLMEWKDTTGNVLASVSGTGKITASALNVPDTNNLTVVSIWGS
jgi:hypothetical protein